MATAIVFFGASALVVHAPAGRDLPVPTLATGAISVGGRVLADDSGDPWAAGDVGPRRLAHRWLIGTRLGRSLGAEWCRPTGQPTRHGHKSGLNIPDPGTILRRRIGRIIKNLSNSW
jgi:hypothetical protein